MNIDKEYNSPKIERSPLRGDKIRRPLEPLYIANNYACSPLGFKSPHFSFVQGGQGIRSPANNCSPSSASLPSRHTPAHLTPVMQCYSDKPHMSNYSSTPVKKTESLDKKHYMTPVSSRPCYPRVLNRKENAPCYPQKPNVYNPFDRCPEQFGFPSVSPSMFKEVVSPSDKEETTFSWAIDHIAILHPASIENSPYSQADMVTDPDFEAKAQEAIDRFFSKAVLSSPWTESPARPVDLLSLLSANEKLPLHIDASALTSPKVKSKLALQETSAEKVKFRNSWTQSEITLPPILPKEVEDVLAPFCTFMRDQTGQEEDDFPSLNSTCLRRKLQFSTEDLMSPTLKPKCSEDSDDECHSMAASVSPIPLADFDDDALPWDTSMIPCRSAFRQCNFCCEANLPTCAHLTPPKLRSSSTGLKIMSPNLSIISWPSPKARGHEAPAALLRSPDVSPIEKWSKKTRKRRHSEEILASTTAGNCDVVVDTKGLERAGTSRNLPLILHADSSPIKMDVESQFSSSLLSLPNSSICNAMSSCYTPCKMSDSLPLSPISMNKSNSMPSDQTFDTFINEEITEPKTRFLFDNNSANVHGYKKGATVTDSGMAMVDGFSSKINHDMVTLSTDSRSMFMDVDSQRFENCFNENSHSQDTGYQTGSFQPSYSSGIEQRNDSVEKELLKAKVHEKFPNIFSSFNFHAES